ncbi:hypothetical protein diail_11710 [Diaporthe ilicicola]|nr:hypothetical protein diail_11710 [Diaporthe ilicicola]
MRPRTRGRIASRSFSRQSIAVALIQKAEKSPGPPPPAPGPTFSQGAGDISVPHERIPAENKTWKTVSDDEIGDYVRRVSMSSLHVSCTCLMSTNEKSGVIDQRLRVHGFKNLRIADASLFPKIPSGHTMAPTMMVSIPISSSRSVQMIMMPDWTLYGTEAVL